MALYLTMGLQSRLLFVAALLHVAVAALKSLEDMRNDPDFAHVEPEMLEQMINDPDLAELMKNPEETKAMWSEFEAGGGGADMASAMASGGAEAESKGGKKAKKA